MSSTDAPRAADFDLRHLDDAFYEDPFPVYRALREHAPVKRLPGGGVFLTRYADVIAVYKDPKTFSSDKHEEFAPKYGVSPLYEHHTTSLVFNDPPLHTRVRRLIGGALTPRHVAAMEDRLVALVDGLLDAHGGGRRSRPDRAYASAIPVEVIGNLLDVPHAERAPLRGWSLAILGALEPVLSPTVEAHGNQAVREMLAYLDGLVERRRASPGDPEVDVLTRLIQGEEGGERLTAQELLHNCIFLLNAGHETTTNLIGNGLRCLAEWPDQRERLLAEPALVRTAVEEFLRYESSNQLGNRITTVERRARRRAAGAAHAGEHGHRRRQPRPRAVRGSRAARHRPSAESPPRLRIGHPPMRRHGPGAPRGPHRHRPLPDALSGLPPIGAAGARRSGRASEGTSVCRCGSPS